jgi:predicted Zn finger-like uncharacterized protein
MQQCKHCNAKIPDEDINPTQQLVKCPACNTVFSLNSEFEARLVQPQQWPGALEFSRLKIETEGDNLHITRRWGFGQKHVGAVTLGLVLLGAVLVGAVRSQLPWVFVITPHAWIGFGALYYALTGLFNSSTITVNPGLLAIKHGPLPFRLNQQVEPATLKQLYTKQKIHRQKNSVRYSYEIRFLTHNGQDRVLLKDFDKAEEAVYLERVIEHFLGIKDITVAGEVFESKDGLTNINWNNWRLFAKEHGFIFTPGKVLEEVRVSGLYDGCHFGMMAFRRDWEQKDSVYTRLELARPAGHQNTEADRPQSIHLNKDKLVSLFNPSRSNMRLKGIVETTARGAKLTYTHKDLITSRGYLEFTLNALRDLIYAYPHLVTLGGEAISALQPIAANKEYFLQTILAQSPQDRNHPLQLVAAQLLQDAAEYTTHLRDPMPYLVCKQCLVHCASHQIEVLGLGTVTFYGCQNCYQSRDFFEADAVIAVLNNQNLQQIHQRQRILRINWLVRRALFDFDTVEILQANDEDVERFAVQVGNDTDPIRKPRYEEMRCLVSKDCGLSDNSLRILRHTFGSVEMGEIDGSPV